MDNPAKLHAISGENAQATFKRLLEVAAANPGAPRAGHPLASPEARKFVLGLVKGLCAETDEGYQLRKAVVQMIEAGETILAIAGQKTEATRP